jgi:hypothetical protein
MGACCTNEGKDGRQDATEERFDDAMLQKEAMKRPQEAAALAEDTAEDLEFKAKAQQMKSPKDNINVRQVRRIARKSQPLEDPTTTSPWLWTESSGF